MKIWRTVGTALAALSMAAIIIPVEAAQAHTGSDNVPLYPPLQGSSTWARASVNQPSQHHIVYSNFGYKNDWSVDQFAGPGRAVLSPFGSKTNTGHAVAVKVVDLRAGCASGKIGDGGYKMTLEARDTVTGAVLGRADLMHIADYRVGVGSTVGPWTVLGTTARFRDNSCYQVSTDAGVHIHMEATQPHRYSCYITRGNGAVIGDQTRIGYVGVHYGGQRAAC